MSWEKGFCHVLLGMTVLASSSFALAETAGKTGKHAVEQVKKQQPRYSQVTYPATSVVLRAKPPRAKPVFKQDGAWVTIQANKHHPVSPFVPLKPDRWYLMEFDAQSSSKTGGRYDFWIAQRFGRGGWHSNNAANGYGFGMADNKVHHFELRYYMPKLIRKSSGLSPLSVDYYKAKISGEDNSFAPSGISIDVRNMSLLDGKKTTLKLRNFSMTPIPQADYRRHAASRRKPFDGRRVRIDALGNWEVRGNDAWESYYPLIMYPAGGLSDYSKYRENGWNTMTQISQIEQARKAVKAGMYYQIDFSQLFGRGDVRAAVKVLKKFRQSDVWNHAVALYFDLENGTELKLDRAKEMIPALKQVLQTDGKQEIPVIVNYLSPEAMIPFGDLFDVVGGYVNTVVSPWDKSSTRGSHLGQLEAFVTAVNSANMRVPVGIGTINMPHEADHLETILWAAIARGARGFGYWRDRYDHTDKTDIRFKQWFDVFPQHAAKVMKALPMLREPDHPAFSLKMSEPENEWGVIFSAREFKGRPVAIVVYQGSNLTTTKKRKTVTFTSDRPVGKVRDLFTNKVVATGKGKQFSLTLAPYGYRVVYWQSDITPAGYFQPVESLFQEARSRPDPSWR